MITALLLVALEPNMFAGRYEGWYRAGFVNPRRIGVFVSRDGYTRMTTGVNRIGTTDVNGNFDVAGDGSRWVGRFEWDGATVVGTFRTEHPLVRGIMWLTRM